MSKVILPQGIDFRGKVLKIKGVWHISTTSFQEFVKCPQRFYYSKVKGIHRVGSMPAALVFGTAMHEALEFMLLNKQVPDFREVWAKYENINLSFSQLEYNFGWLEKLGIEMLYTAEQAFTDYKFGDPYHDEELDKPTTEIQDPVRIGKDLILTRTFDAVLPINGVPTVLDFKTASKMYGDGCEDALSEQLTAYSLPHNLKGVPQAEQAAFLVITKQFTPSHNKVPKAYLYLVKRSQDRLVKLQADLKAVALLLDYGVFFHNRQILTCGSANNPMCDYYPICYGTNKPSELKKMYWRQK